MSISDPRGASGPWQVAVMPPVIEEVEKVALEFRERFRHLDAKTAFSAELLLREALLNAVIHGSRGDETSAVQCEVRARNGNLLIVVSDGGEGFDWRTRMTRVSTGQGCTGRGLEIYRIYANRVRFNTKGSRVALLKRGPEELKKERPSK